MRAGSGVERSTLRYVRRVIKRIIEMAIGPRTDEEIVADSIEFGFVLAGIAARSEEGKRIVDDFVKRMLE
jgi:hypothetical protein